MVTGVVCAWVDHTISACRPRLPSVLTHPPPRRARACCARSTRVQKMWWLHGTSISSYLHRRRRQRRRQRQLLAAPELTQQPPARRRQRQPPSPPVPAFFNAERLGPAAAAAAQSAFASAHPYTYVQLADLLDDTRLLAVRQELSKLHRTFKETDLFKLYQTGDLGNLDRSDPTHAAALPQTLALRDALYSDAFRAFVRRVTGHAAWSQCRLGGATAR